MRIALPSTGALLAIQLAAVLLCFGAIAFAPPRHGRMLLVPLWPGAGNGLAARAIGNGARLDDAGPLPGSLVVTGERAALLPAMLRTGVLTVASPPAGCGKEKRVSA